MNAYYVANANANNTESKRVTLSLLDFIPCQSTSLQKISLLNTCLILLQIEMYTMSYYRNITTSSLYLRCVGNENIFPFDTHQ